MKQNVQKIKPINVLNSWYWIEFTLRTSFFRYHKKKRPLSFKRLMRTFNPNLKSPVFIIGAPRSGTTFLGKCVEQLPEISYHFEPVVTKAASRYVYENKWSHLYARMFYNLIYRLLMSIHFDGDLRFVEKTPRNACIVDFLSRAFPDSKFIHIIRDGRDSALSYSKKPWHKMDSLNKVRYEPGGYLYGPTAHHWVESDRVNEFETTTDLHRSIWSWRIHTEKALESTAVLPPDRIHELRYESLVFNKEEEADKLLNFLEINDLNSRKIFHKAAANVKDSSVGGWKRDFNEEQLNVIYNEAGSLLHLLGYNREKMNKTVEG